MWDVLELNFGWNLNNGAVQLQCVHIEGDFSVKMHNILTEYKNHHNNIIIVIIMIVPKVTLITETLRDSCLKQMALFIYRLWLAFYLLAD